MRFLLSPKASSLITERSCKRSRWFSFSWDKAFSFWKFFSFHSRITSNNRRCRRLIRSVNAIYFCPHKSRDCLWIVCLWIVYALSLNSFQTRSMKWIVICWRLKRPSEENVWVHTRPGYTVINGFTMKLSGIIHCEDRTRKYTFTLVV